MAMARFKRERNRTAEDMLKNMILPHILVGLDVMMQKMTHHNRKQHTYQNRTGALENSVTWLPAKQKGKTIKAAIIAGGSNIKTLQNYKKDKVFYRDKAGRLRVFPLIPPETIRKGTRVNVDYAVHVENMGRPVLIQGIEKFKKQLAKLLKMQAKGIKLRRDYKFKYTGKTADIYGGRV